MRRPYLLEGGDPAFWRELVSLLSRGLRVGLEARPPDRGSWSAVCTRENQRRFPGQSHWGLSGNMKGDRKRQRSLLSANVPIPVFLRTPPPHRQCAMAWAFWSYRLALVAQTRHVLLCHLLFTELPALVPAGEHPSFLGPGVPPGLRRYSLWGNVSPSGSRKSPIAEFLNLVCVRTRRAY